MNTDQIVNVEDRARTAIQLGESHFREFKSALHGAAEQKVHDNERAYVGTLVRRWWRSRMPMEENYW